MEEEVIQISFQEENHREEKNIFKRYYFHNEANKLQQFESELSDATGVFAISNNDTEHFSGINTNTAYIQHINYPIVGNNKSFESLFLYLNLIINNI